MGIMATEPAIGTKIKKARERLRWSQKRLADEVGVSQKTVDNWENGRTQPKSSIGALEEVLGITLTGSQPEPDAGQRDAPEDAALAEFENDERIRPEERLAAVALIREIRRRRPATG